MQRPRRIRVDLFEGPPPYDRLPKTARTEFWLLRPDPKYPNKDKWLLSHYHRGQEKADRYAGEGWDSAAPTLLADHYQKAEAGWQKYTTALKSFEGLKPNKVLRQPGFRPTTVKKYRAQIEAMWTRFANSATKRLEHDMQTLKEGGWPVPERLSFPWEV